MILWEFQIIILPTAYFFLLQLAKLLVCNLLWKHWNEMAIQQAALECANDNLAEADKAVAEAEASLASMGGSSERMRTRAAAYRRPPRGTQALMAPQGTPGP